MNIYQKLIEVRKTVEYLKKENRGQQYSFVSSSQVLINIRRELDKQGLLLIPSIISANVRENSTKTGTLSYFTELTMNFTWINAEKPEEKIEVPFYAQGVDLAGEKGVGKALTYAEKYFMLKSFNIATDKDDPDAFQRRHEDKTDKVTKRVQQQQQKEESKLIQDNKREITNMLIEMFGKDNAQEQLEEYTAFEGRDGKIVKGVTETSKLTGRRLEVTHEKINTDYRTWLKQKKEAEKGE